MRKIRKMPGLFPSVDTGFKFVQDVQHGEEKWAVYHRTTDGFENYKLCVYGKADHKGNYWLSWKDGILIDHTDSLALTTHRPKLYAELLSIVNQAP